MRVAIFFLTYLMLSDRVHAFQWQTCSRDEMEGIVLGFVSNCEKFRSFGCIAKVESFRVPVDPSVDYPVNRAVASVFEDRRARKRRVDFQQTQDFRDELQSSPWITQFVLAGKKRVLENDRELSAERFNQLEHQVMPQDPWMLPLCELSLLTTGRAGDVNYWMDALNFDNFLWAESRNNIVRGEWCLGKRGSEFECRLQVYFDIQQESSPVVTRAFHVKDVEAKFAAKGRSFLSETETKWVKSEIGLLPNEVKIRRENFSSKQVHRSTEFWTAEFEWESKYIDPKDQIHDDVFRPGIVLHEQVIDSFKKSK